MRSKKKKGSISEHPGLFRGHFFAGGIQMSHETEAERPENPSDEIV